MYTKTATDPHHIFTYLAARLRCSDIEPTGADPRRRFSGCQKLFRGADQRDEALGGRGCQRQRCVVVPSDTDGTFMQGGGVVVTAGRARRR